MYNLQEKPEKIPLEDFSKMMLKFCDFKIELIKTYKNLSAEVILFTLLTDCLVEYFRLDGSGKSSKKNLDKLIAEAIQISKDLEEEND